MWLIFKGLFFFILEENFVQLLGKKERKEKLSMFWRKLLGEEVLVC